MNRFAHVLTAIMVLLAGVAAAESQWYKGVTHVHSLWSDGDQAPEMTVAWYLERGYNFVCFSDHNILQQGEKLYPIEEEGTLKPEHIRAILYKFGPEWLKIVDDPQGQPSMQLKTHDELSAHFNKPGEFLLIQAEEITSLAVAVHSNGINLRELVEPGVGDVVTEIQHHIDAVREQSERYGVPMMLHLNHPNWNTGITAEEMIAVRGLQFFEVYNGHSYVNTWGRADAGMPSGDRHWDIVQSMTMQRQPDHILYGLATDDSHNYHKWGTSEVNPGRGWVVVRAEQLSPTAIVQAMQAGDFYSSTGVTLTDVRRTSQSLGVDVKTEPGVRYRIQFIGTLKGFDDSSEPQLTGEGEALPRASREYSDEVGQVLQETQGDTATYEFTGDELYVRARIYSDKLQENPAREGDFETAWVQPVLVK